MKKDTDLDGFTSDDPEYWTLMARAVGNPVPDYVEGEDAEFVDDEGNVVKESETGKKNK
jgi:hypothetical protein